MSEKKKLLVGRAARQALDRADEAIAVGKQLAWARKQADVSQAELAAALGYGRSTVGRIEHGVRVLTGRERAIAATLIGCSRATLMPHVTVPVVPPKRKRAW